MKALYILPNSFTAGSILLGVLSTIYSTQARFELAAWLILVSLVLDGLDGRVARLTNTQSKFGVEFDSLADVIAFGAAPAMLIYFYAGENFGRYGMIVASLFVIFGAIRLARFNISPSIEPNNFIGLPIPSAAVLLVSWVLVDLEHGLLEECAYALLLASFLASILMVSNIRYPSFKKLSLNFRLFIMLLIALALMFVWPIESLCLFMSGYVVYGLLRSVFVLFGKKIGARFGTK